MDLHVIGKDIVRFHAVYWPAFLMSAGLPLPKRVFGHGFLLSKGEKMSKSLGNVVDPMDLVATYGVDAVRHFVLREVPFGGDGNYSHEAIITRYTADLSNGLGNLAQRSLSMIAKNLSGSVPEHGDFTEDDRALLALADALPDVVRAAMDKLALHTALAEIWAVITAADRYFDAQKPWVLRKSDPVRMAASLYVVAETLRAIGILVQPFMPGASARLLDLLAVPADRRQLADVGEGGRLVPGTALPPPAGLFPRFVEPEASSF